MSSFPEKIEKLTPRAFLKQQNLEISGDASLIPITLFSFAIFMTVSTLMSTHALPGLF